MELPRGFLSPLPTKVKEAPSLYQTILNDASFYRVLLRFDDDLAEQARREGCGCGGKLHSARYPRKPRGAPEELQEEYSRRRSFCCAEEGCRKRTTPASFRFPAGSSLSSPNPAGSVSEPKPLGKSTRRSPGVLCRALRLELLQHGIHTSAYTNPYPYPASSTSRRSLSLVYRDHLAISYRDHAHQRRFPVIHWIQSDSPGPLRDDSPSNPCSLSSL